MIRELKLCTHRAEEKYGMDWMELTEEENVPWKELLDDIDKDLLAEHIAYTDVSEHDVSSVLRNSQNRLLDRLKEIGDTGHLETILFAEHSILSFEKNRYVNSAAMEASLDNALHEIKIAFGAGR